MNTNNFYVEQIIEARKVYGVTYKTIAERIGVSASFISKVVHGVKLLPVKYHPQIDKLMGELKGEEL